MPYAAQKDCCGCRYEVVLREFYYRKSADWLPRQLRKFNCCVSATLGFLRLFNLLMILYGLLITGFCLFAVFGPEWMPEQYGVTNETAECLEVSENCTDAQVIFSGGGWTNLLEGGTAFWAVAVLQGLAAFWLGPLPFCGHTNTICCGTRTMPIIAAAAAFDFLLFLCCVALLAASLVPDLQGAFPKWTRSHQVVWLVTVGVDGLGLLIAFALSVSFRNNFLLPAATRSKADRPTEVVQALRPTSERYNADAKNSKSKDVPALEMVTVAGSGESKSAATTEGEGDGPGDGPGGPGPKASHAAITRSWSDEVDAGNMTGEGGGPNGAPPAWEIPPEQVEDGELIGEGFFGQCFKAKWHEQLVVVKRFKNGIRGEGADAARKNFHREVAILVQLRHPRICQFLGACARPDNLFIVLEFMANGSLQDCLHTGSRKPHTAAAGGGRWVPLSRAQKLRILSDVALGLAYLHKCTPAIIHRDLTSANVLLDEQFRAKVSDFGLSRPYDYRMTLRPGNRFYMAPELLLGTSMYTTAVDMYSLAIIMWEVYANERPYADISASQMKNEVGVKQARPKLPLPPGRCDPRMETLMAQCWHSDPCLRPTALALYSQLQNFEASEATTDGPRPGQRAQQVSQAKSVRHSGPPPPAHDYGTPPPPPYGGAAAAGAGSRSSARYANLSSDQAFIQRSVDQALATLDENLKTDDGRRMLEEDMVAKNLPDEATARAHLIEVVRKQTEDAARQKCAYARMQHLD